MRRTGTYAAGGLVFSTLALAAAGWMFWPIYRDPHFLVLAAVAIGAGSLLAGLGALFRLPSAVLVPATVALYALVGVPLAIPELAWHGILPTGDGIARLAVATVTGWKQLLTVSVPVGSYQALLVPALAAILPVTVATVSAVLRAPRPEAAALGPAALAVTAILFGPGVAELPAAAPLLLLVVILWWLVWLRWRRRSAQVRMLAEQSGVIIETGRERRSLGLRTVLSAALILAVSAGAGTAMTAVAPGHAARDVLRTRIATPFDPNRHPSPLSGFRAWLKPAEASTALFTVSGLAGRRIALADLDAYNGVVYAVGGSGEASGTFSRLPYRIDRSGTPGTRTTLTVSIRGYSGVWVPSQGALEQIAFEGRDAGRLDDAFYYDRTLDTAAVTRALRRGDRYRVDTVVRPETSIRELASMRPGTAAQPRIAVVPDGLTTALRQDTRGAATPGRKLAAALTALKTHGYISHGLKGEPPSRSGHSADRITELLTDDPMLGDQEQYAVAAALMARRLGFPARVVVGFAAPRKADLDGPVTFTGKDASAWIEVQTTRGWVTVDPNPAPRPIPHTQPERPTTISRPQTVVPPPPDEATKPLQEAPTSHVDRNSDQHPEGWLAALRGVLVVAGWSLAVLALIASPFLAVIAAKLRRRRIRRRAPRPGERIAGGWQEFVDTARDLDYPVPPGSTRTEFAASLGAGGRQRTLARVADRAAFAPEEPTPAEAEEAWEAVAALRRTLREGRTRRQRMRAAVSLRSLGYRGSNRPRRKKDER